MLSKLSRLRPETAIVFLWVLVPQAVFAQVAADSSLSTQVNLANPANPNQFLIEGGQLRGNNLFHSFDEFSVPTGGSVTFTGTGIENIINRVTGSNISEINGLIQANNQANIFLLNPNGIIFGENAQLNIGGSFFATTGESIRFADGTEFSAATAATPSLLTVSAPIGVQYGANPGAIAVTGSGSNLQLDFNTFAIDRTNRTPGLTVNSGETLVLAGGDINFTGGNITAPDGRIELASVGANEFLELTSLATGWTLNADSVATFGDITLTETASADVSGGGGGDLQVIGKTLSLSDGSALLSNTEGTLAGGDIRINTTEAVNVAGVRVDANGNPLFASRIFAEVSPGATGQGGDVTVSTGSLNLSDGAQIAAQTFGLGDAGTLTVNANQILSLGGTPLGPTGLFSITANLGNAGELEITTGYLGIGGGSQLSTSSFSPSNAGKLTINADTIEVVGGAPGLGASSILSRGEIPAYQGTGGELSITTNNLTVANGARIETGSSGSGNGGLMTIDANNILLVGTSPSGNAAGLFSDIDSGSSGDGGDIEISTQVLEVFDGAQIAVATSGSGTAGDLNINANRVELAGAGSITQSGLFASALSPIGNPQTGTGGNITVNSDRVLIRDGATISASNFPSNSNNPNFEAGQGPAGNVTVSGNLVELQNGATITASTTTGGRGNVTVNATDLLQLSQASNIATNAQGTEPGGNIKIDTAFVIGQGNSDITANAVNAQGGQVDITTNALFGIQAREQLTEFSDITASSELGTEFQGIITINSPEVDPSEGLTELPETPVDVSRLIAQGCAASQGNVFVVTGRGGLPQAPNQTLRGMTVWQDLRPLEGDALAQTLPAVATPQQLVEAQGWLTDANGDAWLVTQTPTASPHASFAQVVSCRDLDSERSSG